MNHLDNGTTPFDEEQEMMECPHCLGSKEEFESTDEEGLTGNMITCTVCEGDGEIPRIDGYTAKLDFIDDQADEFRDEDLLESDD